MLGMSRYLEIASKRVKEDDIKTAAEAIWTPHGSPFRLLHEISRPGSNLDEQQSRCWKQARAVVAALFP